MSGANDHLRWLELSDFTGGLWTVSDFAMPLTVAQVMDDCYALPQGGIRAHWKPTAYSADGIGVADRVMAVYAFSESLASNRYACVTHSTADRKFRYYSKLSSDPTWALLWTSATTTSTATVGKQDIAHHRVGSDIFLYFVIRGTDGSDGVYRHTPTTGAVASAFTGGRDHLVTHQARLVTRHIDALERITWSDPGSQTFAAANYIDVEPGLRGRAHAFYMSFPPSELLLGTVDGSIVSVQGTLNLSASVRVLNNAPVIGASTGATRSPWGGLFLVRDDGLWSASPSASLTNLAGSLSGDDFALLSLLNNEDALGDVTFHRESILCVRGLVLDMRTRAWAKVSALDKACHLTRDPGNNRVLVALGGAPPAFFTLSLSDSADRASSYILKTAPLRHPEGRRLEIGEVEIPLRSFGVGGSVTIEVGDKTGDKAVTVQSLNTGRHVVRTPVGAIDDVLDVRITAASGSAAVEAPLVESIRLGTNARQLVT